MISTDFYNLFLGLVSMNWSRERGRDFKMMDLNERTNLTPLDRLTIVMDCVKRVIFLETEITAYDNRSSKIMCFSSLNPNEQDCKALKLLDY